jgi:hypothetical protein
MSTLKQLLEKKHELHNQRETFQKELSSLFNQKDIFDIIKESLSEELSTTNISEDEVCVRLNIKQYKDKPNDNYYVLEFYQKLHHLYPTFLIKLKLNDSKDKLIIQLLEFTNYKLEMSKDEIIQHIRDLIGV